MKGITSAIPTSRGAARDLPGLATDAGHRAPAALGVTAVELLPVHQFVDRPAPGRARADQLLGLQHHRLLRARRALRHRRPRGQQVAEFKTMVKRAARGRHRGDPRRGLQPHRRGQPPRADALLPRHRQRRLLPPRSATHPRYYIDFTGCGNTLNMRAPADAAAGDGQPALLGERDARRRLPLRPRPGARPASCTTSNRSARSSTSSARTRWSPRSS